MPVELHVRQVRDEILRAAGGPLHGLSNSSSRLVGSLFHAICADLLGRDARLQARAALPGGSSTAEEWSARLRDHIYRLLLGPRVEANQAALQTATREVLDLWKSLEALAQWLAAILHEAWRRRFRCPRMAQPSWRSPPRSRCRGCSGNPAGPIACKSAAYPTQFFVCRAATGGAWRS
jgi:hypothetical protein